ncbi:hypothetical protein [Streptomyces sp. I05A-00742]|uniref:hypothetical protein n=1 Tax=Streptomyces sp. I05A-00742 TaxID=2732853 RepID=UPI00289A450B|nr:hypothetical protein [Streptomyces sp. I05A-00742]
MKLLLRGTLVAAVAGAASIALAVGSAISTAAPSARPSGDPALSYAVEGFEYPNAAKILKERGIALRKGDGHILLSDCAVTQDIVVNTNNLDNVDRGKYCFKVKGTGKSGQLTLEIPKVISITAGNYLVQASLTTEGRTTEVGVSKYDTAVVGQGANPTGNPAVLVKLRVKG